MIVKNICHISFILFLFTVAYSNTVSDSSKNIASPSHSNSDVLRLDTMCGPNCLWQIAKAFGKDCTPLDIAKYAGTDVYRGTNIKGLLEACKRIGLPAEAVQTDLKRLNEDPRVAVLLLNTGKLNHFVILDKINDSKVRLLDSTRFREMSFNDLKSIWDGYAILVGRSNINQLGQVHRYVGRSFQISGLLIFFVLAMYILNKTHFFFRKQKN